MKHTDVISRTLDLDALEDLPEEIGLVAYLGYELRACFLAANRSVLSSDPLRRWARGEGSR